MTFASFAIFATLSPCQRRRQPRPARRWAPSRSSGAPLHKATRPRRRSGGARRSSAPNDTSGHGILAVRSSPRRHCGARLTVPGSAAGAWRRCELALQRHDDGRRRSGTSGGGAAAAAVRWRHRWRQRPRQFLWVGLHFNRRRSTDAENYNPLQRDRGQHLEPLPHRELQEPEQHDHHARDVHPAPQPCARPDAGVAMVGVREPARGRPDVLDSLVFIGTQATSVLAIGSATNYVPTLVGTGVGAFVALEQDLGGLNPADAATEPGLLISFTPAA
ncbi:hypothetical protein B0H17DRAFT_1123776 [Mycena rosella]|uniref:Uncharacterized protein n=1 Tax=Mycena rosella TaxID=1033263 RepID=A0AAD7MCI2_MYCRO|nr:hypothetical protein B0H17DRAFT_1123776 [Mycena rosella]